jgi:hypothetical protein
MNFTDALAISKKDLLDNYSKDQLASMLAYILLSQHHQRGSMNGDDSEDEGLFTIRDTLEPILLQTSPYDIPSMCNVNTTAKYICSDPVFINRYIQAMLTKRKGISSESDRKRLKREKEKERKFILKWAKENNYNAFVEALTALMKKEDYMKEKKEEMRMKRWQNFVHQRQKEEKEARGRGFTLKQLRAEYQRLLNDPNSELYAEKEKEMLALAEYGRLLNDPNSELYDAPPYHTTYYRRKWSGL